MTFFIYLYLFIYESEVFSLWSWWVMITKMTLNEQYSTKVIFSFSFFHHLFSLFQKLLQVQLYHATLGSKGKGFWMVCCVHRAFSFCKMNYYLDLILEIKLLWWSVIFLGFGDHNCGEIIHGFDTTSTMKAKSKGSTPSKHSIHRFSSHVMTW